MSNKKQLHIHIGIMKTGSTAIQGYLAQNLGHLQSSGIAYPQLTGHGFGWMTSRGFSSGNAFVEHGGTLGQFFAEVSSSFSNHDHVILSHEVLYLGAARELFWQELDSFSIKNDIAVNVFGYLRDPFEYFLSSYQQAIKDIAFVHDLDEYVKEYPKLHYSAAYRDISRIWELGLRSRSKLSFYRYEDARKDLIGHFFRVACGLESYSPVAFNSYPNQSLSLAEQEILKGINETSSKVGRLFAFELKDTLRNAGNKAFKIPLTYTLTEESRRYLVDMFESYRTAISSLFSFADRVNFSLDSSKIVTEHSELDLAVRSDLRNLGNIIGRFSSTGYLPWQIEKDLKKEE